MFIFILLLISLFFCFIHQLKDPESLKSHVQELFPDQVKKKNCNYIWVIDQSRDQDGWILPSSVFCVFIDRDRVEVQKLEKRIHLYMAFGVFFLAGRSG